ncbi:MAG: tryptophan synthase subunit alpha [Nitrospinae bacterium]|nr:tryptophan synthase subunit alpha [Nitrospinota bacterium]
MSRIDQAFTRLRGGKRKALTIFLTAGDPSLARTVDLVKAAADNGADIVELGLPFSDPLADGPVIQESFLRAIAGGTNVIKSLAMVERLRISCDVPLVAMLASTLVINHGTPRFMKDAAAAGFDGIIIPDAPVDEYDEFLEPARKAGLDTILLAAPTSGPARMKRIAAISTGFLYYINVTGVTGGADAKPASIAKDVKTLKGMTKTPVLAGFGISTPAQAKAFAAVADGIIIGSQAMRVIRSVKRTADAPAALGAFVRSVRNGMDGR